MLNITHAEELCNYKSDSLITKARRICEGAIHYIETLASKNDKILPAEKAYVALLQGKIVALEELGILETEYDEKMADALEKLERRVIAQYENQKRH